MIKTFRARNYGCLKDVTAELTPLHAFIGPNDSGKSTLLHGMRTLFHLASGDFTEDKEWGPFDPYLPVRFPATSSPKKQHDLVLACGFEHGWYAYVVGPDGPRERVGNTLEGIRRGTNLNYDESRLATMPGGLPHHTSGGSALARVAECLRGARLARFDPDALRNASGLIPEREAVGLKDDRGHGLAGVYFAIRNRDDDAFSAIVNDVRRHFPTIRSIRVKAVTTSEVVLEAELVSGVRVEAKRMSEGLLYYLAFAALRHIDPVSLLLVEEPENGLHPARIAEVIRILRAIVAETGTQVVMATHSPLVVNELRPEEVSVVTRTAEHGTRVKRIHETPDFEARSKIYALGELWIAYANGEDEAPLLEGTEP